MSGSIGGISSFFNQAAKSIQDTFDRGQKITDPEQIALLSNAWDKAESYEEDMALLDPGFNEGGASSKPSSLKDLAEKRGIRGVKNPETGEWEFTKPTEDYWSKAKEGATALAEYSPAKPIRGSTLPRPVGIPSGRVRYTPTDINGLLSSGSRLANSNVGYQPYGQYTTGTLQGIRGLLNPQNIIRKNPYRSIA
jgi:hypothetical protein